MWTNRWAGIVAAVVITLLLLTGGCQNDRATVPAVTVEPSIPADAVEEPRASAPAESVPPTVVIETPEGQVALPEPNEAGRPVELVLAFAPGQVATYKATTEAEKSVEWMGPASAKPAGYADGRSGNYVEMTFRQRVQEVHESGNAVVEITIEGLRYLGQTQSKVTLDFDSRRAEDQANPLMALVGKSYLLGLSPKSEVVALLDMASVRQAVKVGSPAYSVATNLFSDEIVRDRHEVPPLSALKSDEVRPGQSWSDLKSFSFGQMGLKSFERVYTLQPMEQGNGRTAVVAMKAIPSAAMAEELHKKQPAGPPPGLFDNLEQYEGRLTLDLNAGRIDEYEEQMKTEWVIVDPATAQGAIQPLALKMGARRLHRLELVQR